MNKIFTKISNYISDLVGRPISFIVSILVVLLWALCGPYFNYSDAWQLVINTGTTILTFLMVFCIQNTQNRDNAAIHAKLDDLIMTSEKAHSILAGTEKLTLEELNTIKEQLSTVETEVEKEINDKSN